MRSIELTCLGWSPKLAFCLEELGDATLVGARVCRVDRGSVSVLVSEGERRVDVVRPVPMSDGDGEAMPTVGDWCALADVEDARRIVALLPRATSLSRAVARGRRTSQSLAANVDVAFVVTGLDQDFSVRRIERYVALARQGGVRPVVVLNKVDVCSEPEARAREIEGVAPGTDVLLISAHRHGDLEAIREHLPAGVTGVLLGSSGAGKSTIINGLLGRSRQDTQEVRDKDSRGRHTTTHRELLLLPDGGALIDSPGLREVGVLVDEHALAESFEDIAALATACHFADCQHESEPRCSVRAAVQDGGLDAGRLESFLRLRKEARNALLRQDTHAAREEERRTVGKYRKWLKDAYRLKGR